MEMFTTPALAVAVAAMVPLMVAIAWIDLKDLRIPNWSIVAIFAVWVVCGIWGLPIDIFLWRTLAGVVTLVLGIGIWSLWSRIVGAGDMKMIAVLVPFVRPIDAGGVILAYCAVTLVALVIHRLVRAFLRGRQTGWKAFDQKIFFPVGLLLGITMSIYLVTLLAWTQG